MGRKQINDEAVLAGFPEGTLARVDAVLLDREKRAAFIREAVERELEQRESALALMAQRAAWAAG